MGFYVDPHGREPARLLEDWPSLVDVAEAASKPAIRVSVVQACSRTEQFARNGVHYYFLPFNDASKGDAPLAAYCALLRSLAPDVFHVHGLDFPRQVLSLAELNPGVPIILQDHASRPPRIWRRASARSGMSAAAGIAFCSL